jgi:hypothetical protein
MPYFDEAKNNELQLIRGGYIKTRGATLSMVICDAYKHTVPTIENTVSDHHESSTFRWWVFQNLIMCIKIRMPFFKTIFTCRISSLGSRGSSLSSSNSSTSVKSTLLKFSL